MELGEHEPNEPPVADCDCRRCAVATRDALRKDAERYRWLREHFRFANDSMRELWFDPVLEPNDSGVPDDLDQEIDHAMSGANAEVRGEGKRSLPESSAEGATSTDVLEGDNGGKR